MQRRNSNQSNGQWDQASILHALRAPGLRMGDVPNIAVLAEQLSQFPDDPYLQDVFTRVVQDQATAELISGDPFHGNPPPQGVLPRLTPGRFPVLRLPNGEFLTTDLSRPQNILLAAPTGQGKSNLIKLFLLSAMASPPCLVVAFDRKPGELIDSRSLSRAGLPLLVLHWKQLQVALLQPPTGVNVQSFANTLTHLLARESHLFASRRLMLETLERLYRKPRQQGTWPTFVEWMNVIENIRVNATSRMGQYREAALFAMKQVCIELQGVVNYAASDMLQRLFERHGVVVIITEGLSSDMQALLASVFLNYAYRARQTVSDYFSLAPLYVILDDALNLAAGSAASEAEGGVNPLSEWAFMGRSRRLSLVVSTQSYSLMSPAMRANCHVTICLGSYGRDADELSRHLSLSPEQAARLPFLRVGEAVARIPPWPAMYGFIPEVP